MSRRQARTRLSMAACTTAGDDVWRLVTGIPRAGRREARGLDVQRHEVGFVARVSPGVSVALDFRQHVQ